MSDNDFKRNPPSPNHIDEHMLSPSNHSMDLENQTLCSQILSSSPAGLSVSEFDSTITDVIFSPPTLFKDVTVSDNSKFQIKRKLFDGLNIDSKVKHLQIQDSVDSHLTPHSSNNVVSHELSHTKHLKRHFNEDLCYKTSIPPKHLKHDGLCEEVCESELPCSNVTLAVKGEKLGGGVPQDELIEVIRTDENVYNYIREGFEEILRFMMEDQVEAADRVGLTICNASRPDQKSIGVSLRRADQMSTEVILKTIEAILQSNESFFVQGPLEVSGTYSFYVFKYFR